MLIKNRNKIKYLKYANVDAMKNNFIMAFFYIIAYPLVKQFIHYSIKPNTITSTSLILAPLSIIFLLFGDIYFYFLFLFLSIYLDFCDGSVARALNEVSTSAFNYDHMSDILKISIVITGIAIYFNSLLFWVITTTTIIMFMIYNITHHDISFHKRNKNDSGRNKKNIILSNIRTLLGTINGHTWLGLLIIPVDYTGAVIYLIYINLILFFI